MHFHGDIGLIIPKIVIGSRLDLPQSLVLLCVLAMVVERLLPIGLQNLNSFLDFVERTLPRPILKGLDVLDALPVLFVVVVLQVLAPGHNDGLANVVHQDVLPNEGRHEHLLNEVEGENT